MTRRIVLLVGALSLGLVLAATWAQQPGRIPTVGILMTGAGPDDPLVKALRRGLSDRGYVEGQNIKFEFRSALLHAERAPHLAEELVQVKVDVIVAGADTAIRAAKQATSTIPIVMVVFDDPKASGLIDSLNRPGQTSLESLRASPNSPASASNCLRNWYLACPVSQCIGTPRAKESSRRSSRRPMLWVFRLFFKSCSLLMISGRHSKHQRNTG